MKYPVCRVCRVLNHGRINESFQASVWFFLLKPSIASVVKDMGMGSFLSIISNVPFDVK
jgi:hypothetical protein